MFRERRLPATATMFLIFCFILIFSFQRKEAGQIKVWPTSLFDTLVLTVIQGGGACVLGLGCVSLFSAISSRNSTELTEGILKAAGGLGMLIVPGIIKLYT